MKTFKTIAMLVWLIVSVYLLFSGLAEHELTNEENLSESFGLFSVIVSGLYLGKYIVNSENQPKK